MSDDVEDAGAPEQRRILEPEERLAKEAAEAHRQAGIRARKEIEAAGRVVAAARVVARNLSVRFVTTQQEKDLILAVEAWEKLQAGRQGRDL